MHSCKCIHIQLCSLAHVHPPVMSADSTSPSKAKPAPHRGSDPQPTRVSDARSMSQDIDEGQRASGCTRRTSTAQRNEPRKESQKRPKTRTHNLVRRALARRLKHRALMPRAREHEGPRRDGASAKSKTETQRQTSICIPSPAEPTQGAEASASYFGDAGLIPGAGGSCLSW